MAMYLIGHDKRGVSAMFISHELSIRYDPSLTVPGGECPISH
jgi:hypothetical protein